MKRTFAYARPLMIFLNPSRTLQVSATLIVCSFLLLFIAACDKEEAKQEPAGSLFLWGMNQYGQIGDGTTENRSTPVQVGEDHNWQQISFGSQFVIGLRDNGTLWAWGSNANGRLGLGDVGDKYSPVQIGTDSDWTSVSCGLSNVFALKNDGTLWTWGDPTIQFDRGGPAPFSLTPVQVDFEDTWVEVCAGAWHVVAKKRDGTFWTWGFNTQGQLGDGTAEPKYLPVALGTDQTWKEIVPGFLTTMGIKRDGTLWAWGSNSMGHFGTNGDPVRAHDPIQLGNDNTWDHVSVGQFHALAIKKDGSLWAWGWNSLGSVGNGFAAQETVPITRIGSDTDWKAVAAGRAHSLALKKNGTAYAWGDNRSGQASAGSEYQTVPLEIPSDRSWLSVATGQGSMSSGGIKE